jgi:hypothetical protein
MSTTVGNLPPPFPNAAQSLSRISGDAQLRERVERASENAAIQTDLSPEALRTGQSTEAPEIIAQQDATANTPQPAREVQGADTPNPIESAATGESGQSVDLSV